jgi:NADH-quinone oxidoreductase subunit G
VELIKVTIDGVEVEVPKGTLAIRAAESVGIAIPRFCDHPLLEPIGACRQCLVEVPDAGNGRGFPIPQAACTLATAPGMQIKTQATSQMARDAQVGVQELILLNHPLDCPICDKAGECPLQNQAFANGRAESRYDGVKRTYPKPLQLSPQILLDRERCVLCARCTRFSEQISGDPLIALTERGAVQQVGLFADEPYNSYFSGNVVQICPVGALTAKSYRFNSRPFDLVSTDTTCEHCAAGCQLRTDHRHFTTRRRLAGAAPEVNEEWNCDKGRFAFASGHEDRLTTPLVREDGQLRPASWPEAIAAAAAGLQAAGDSVGVLTGGRLTLENAYAYSKFARIALGTNNIDFRSRPGSDEEAGFLAHAVAGVRSGVTYAALESAKRVVLVAFEPEDEAPIVFLRLRKAVRKNKLRVLTIAPFASLGSQKLGAELVQCLPGQEVAALQKLELDADTIVLVGERAALSPDTLDQAVHLTAKAQAGLAWIPRRAGDRGAVEAGCLPNLLPGGRPVGEPAARVDMAASWGEDLPIEPGLTSDGMLEAGLAAYVAAGIEPADYASQQAVQSALGNAFVVSLENRVSPVHDFADVVLPVALIEEQSGHFLNWEHRGGFVGRVNTQAKTAMTDLRALGMLAAALGKPLGLASTSQAAAEFAALGPWEGKRAALVSPAKDSPKGLLLASWHQLLDASRALDGAPELATTARPAKALLGPKTAKKYSIDPGAEIAVIGSEGQVRLPAEISEGMVEGAVWLPAKGTPAQPYSIASLGVAPGGVVELKGGDGNE